MTSRRLYGVLLIALAALDCPALLHAAAPPAAAGGFTQAPPPRPSREAEKAGDGYQLGRVRVSVPPPAGYEEATSQIKTVKDIFRATEDPGNDLLAVHIPAADAARLKAGGRGFPETYTKVSVNKALRGADTPAADFPRLVSLVRSSLGEVIDADGPTMRSAVENIEKGLSNLTETRTSVGMSQPLNLGEFVSQPDAFGVTLLVSMKVQVGDRQVEAPMVCAVTFLRVRQRVLYVYAYRRYRSAADRGALEGFTRQWLCQIAAANRP